MDNNERKGKDITLFLATACIVFAEAFLFIDRITGGGLNTVLAAAAVMVVFLVLVGIFPKLKNEKIKAVMAFVFAGLEFLSVFTMKGILGNLFLGIVPPAIVLVGTLDMLRKAAKEKDKEERFAKKKNVVAGTEDVPEATQEEKAAEEEATAEAV